MKKYNTVWACAILSSSQIQSNIVSKYISRCDADIPMLLSCYLFQNICNVWKSLLKKQRYRSSFILPTSPSRIYKVSDDYNFPFMTLIEHKHELYLKGNNVFTSWYLAKRGIYLWNEQMLWFAITPYVNESCDKPM